MSFRTLTAEEIECRIGMIKDNGLTLLLYKNARVDMDILDETFGIFGWKREHSRDNANCTVSVFDADKKEWVSKEDTGTESNTEAEKGLASDSFKRACVNWGIGRELYTAPFIWVSSDHCTIQNRKCFDKFSVAEIGYDDKRRICDLSIRNDKTRKIVFEYHAGKMAKQKAQTPPQPPKAEQPPQDVDVNALRNRLNKITFALAQGKQENIATAVSIWTKEMFVRLEDIPDNMVASVLAIAERAYRKRGFTD